MTDERWMESPPEGAEGWRRVWQENLRQPITETGSFLGRRMRAFIRRVVQSVSREEAERQRNFNLASLEMFDDARRNLESLHRDLIQTTKDLAALGVELQKFQQLLPVAVQRNDALLVALDQKIETISVRIRDITTKLIAGDELPVRTRGDLVYRRLEDGLRGSPQEIREHLRPYVEYARRSAPVVDVGCGRGEFLALCREAGIEACGFDTNERSIADLSTQGFDVQLRAVPDCLIDLSPAKTGSILATHVVEHLNADALFEFFASGSRALRSGGLLMIETPNAESLAMSGSDFWRDPTHLAPRHVAALTLLAREFGFDIEELRAVNDFPPARRIQASEQADPALKEVVSQLNEVLYGNQDLRLVLRKR